MATIARRLIGGKTVQIQATDYVQIQLRPPLSGTIVPADLVVETSNRAALAGAGATFVMIALLGNSHGSVAGSQSDGWNDDAPTQTIERGGIPAFVGRGEVVLLPTDVFGFGGGATAVEVGQMITSGAAGEITASPLVAATAQFGRIFRVLESQAWMTFDSFARVLA